MKSIIIILLVLLSLMSLNVSVITASTSSSSSPIVINGNADFSTQAASNSWPGSGSSGDPYIIANYSITTNNAYSFIIENTDLYFVFENNTISGGVIGVYLHNVRHGILNNNIISNSEKFGILFDGADNNTAIKNTIDHTSDGMGVLITNSNNNLFDNNTAEFNSANGFFISQNSTNNVFSNNYAISNGNANSGVGFYVVFTTGNSLVNNYAFNNTISGIFVENSAGTYLKNNTEIENGKILEGESYSKILLFLAITVLLLAVAIILTLINKKLK